jgi:hypothetical protein
MRSLPSRFVRPLAAAAVLVTGGASLLQTTPARASQHRSAAQLLKQAFADARAERSFHLVSTEAGGGGLHASFVQDVGVGVGRQHIANPQGVVADVEVTGGHAYFAGNRTALVKYFGFPESIASTIGSRWVSLSQSDSGYRTVAANVTMQTALTGLGPVGTLTVGPRTTIDGHTVVGVSGRAPGLPAGAKGSETAYVTDTHHPLPVVIAGAITQSPHPRVSTQTTFSHWGEPLSIPAPADSVAYDSLGG